MSVEKALREIGSGFWNIRGHFKILVGIVDIGTHMSIARLSNGKYLIIDTIPLNDQIKQEIDELTENGTKIEAVIGTHPFHTLAFKGFHQAYPNVPYYGTPRHLRNLKEIEWAGDLNDCSTRNKWSPDIEMRIPDGAEFVAPQPESSNHFNSVFVFHKESRTIHVDDTIMYSENPGFLLKLIGFRHGTMAFHPSMKGPGLYPTPEAPFQFRDWVRGLINDWDFDNICTAHFGNKVGGAKAQLQETLEKAEPLFQKLSDKNKKKGSGGSDDHSSPTINNVSGHECG